MPGLFCVSDTFTAKPYNVVIGSLFLQIAGRRINACIDPTMLEANQNIIHIFGHGIWNIRVMLGGETYTSISSRHCQIATASEFLATINQGLDREINCLVDALDSA